MASLLVATKLVWSTRKPLLSSWCCCWRESTILLQSITTFIDDYFEKRSTMEATVHFGHRRPAWEAIKGPLLWRHSHLMFAGFGQLNSRTALVATSSSLSHKPVVLLKHPFYKLDRQYKLGKELRDFKALIAYNSILNLAHKLSIYLSNFLSLSFSHTNSNTKLEHFFHPKRH